MADTINPTKNYTNLIYPLSERQMEAQRDDEYSQIEAKGRHGHLVLLRKLVIHLVKTWSTIYCVVSNAF